jgi:predicted metalloprotease
VLTWKGIKTGADKARQSDEVETVVRGHGGGDGGGPLVVVAVLVTVIVVMVMLMGLNHW